MRSQKADSSLSYASAGLGTVSHLSGVLFTSASGASLIHVPYKGTAAAQVDLLAGRVQIMFDSLSSGLVNAKSGKVKALAVTSPKRWPMAPDLPTLGRKRFARDRYDGRIWIACACRYAEGSCR
jgi:tripartite-type tricarboxylate transporter receptor subunit TctC